MKTRPDANYSVRKQFFDERAIEWIDMWYTDPKSPAANKHYRDFERLFSLLNVKPGDRVLDAGCGTGVLVPFIMERIGGAGELVELDFSEQMIETNRSLHRQPNIRCVVADVEHAPLEATAYDLAICFSCFPHFYDKGRSLQVIANSLKPAGLVCVAHFASDAEINDHHRKSQAVMHDMLPDEQAMCALFAQTELQIELFINEPGFYCILARK